MPDLVSNADHAQVLVVEDDRLLRTLAVETLLDDGILAIGVEAAIEALEFLKLAAGLDLLITDINMPGMSGMELAAIVQQSYPAVRLLLVSGREQLDPFLLPHPLAFLQKPFSAQKFLLTVRSLLDG